MDSGLYQQVPFRQAAGCEFRPGGIGLTGELAAACGLRPGERVLDLGCGVGSTASYLTSTFGVRVIGLDASPEFLDEARGSDGSVEWVLGRADAIPFQDDSFDVVFAECFLAAFDDPGPILGEMRRVLRPGGRLAVSDMYLREPGVAAPAGAPHAAPAAAAADPAASVAAPAEGSVPAATCLNGARGKDATLAAFQRAGFAGHMWLDRSDALKLMMASLIMTYGSAARFWEAAGGCAAGVTGRPGYYLLIAEVVDV